MTQGIFIYGSRAKFKKEFKEAVDGVNRYLKLLEEHGGDHAATLMAALKETEKVVDPFAIVIEATSIRGDEFDGSLALAMSGPPNERRSGPFYIVGPDPHTKRNWYARLHFDALKAKWVLQ